LEVPCDRDASAYAAAAAGRGPDPSGALSEDDVPPPPPMAVPSASYFGAFFSAFLPDTAAATREGRALAKGNKEDAGKKRKLDPHRADSNLYNDLVDKDNSSIDDSGTITSKTAEGTNGCNAIDPGCGLGPLNPSIANSSLLRFLAVRNENSASPQHPEVETSLTPLEQGSEHGERKLEKHRSGRSSAVHRQVVYGNGTTMPERIVLDNRELYDEYPQNDGNMSVFDKTFGRFLKQRGRNASSAAGRGETAIQEIHETYSHGAVRKPPPTTIDTTQRTNSSSSSLRPDGFYKNPSTVLANSPPRRENGGSSPGRPSARENNKDEEAASQQQQFGLADNVEVYEDDGTVGVYTGLMCGNDMGQLLSADGWCA